MENTQKKFITVHLALHTVTVCSWIAYSSNSAAKKILLIVEYLLLLIEILHDENVENSSFDVTSMGDQFATLPAVRKIFVISKDQ